MDILLTVGARYNGTNVALVLSQASHGMLFLDNFYNRCKSDSAQANVIIFEDVTSDLYKKRRGCHVRN